MESKQADSKIVHVRIRRGEPGEAAGHFSEYDVPLDEKMSVFNVIEYIQSNLDSSLAYYASCRIGKCMGCMLKVNGKLRLACTTLVDGELTLEPDHRYPVIRDLVVDMSSGGESDAAE
jgi:succinate dehydrogenase/fumarate reductase iron-sulfur protein